MKHFLLMLIVLSSGTVSSGAIGMNSSCNRFLDSQSFNKQVQEKKKWALLEQYENIEIYFTLDSCSNNPVFLYKLINKNPYGVKVNWDTEIILNRQKISGDINTSIQVKANETVTGNCDNSILTINPYNYVSSVNNETELKIKNLIIEKK